MEVLASRVLLRPVDFAASLAFYEDVLGLARFREFGRAPRRGVVFFLGGAYVELTEGGDSQDAGRQAARDTAGHGGPHVRLWLQVRDLATACDRLRGRGVRLVEPPELRSWGLLEAVVHDPDGLPLVLVEVPADHPLRHDTRTAGEEA